LLRVLAGFLLGFILELAEVRHGCPLFRYWLNCPYSAPASRSQPMAWSNKGWQPSPQVQAYLDVSRSPQDRGKSIGD
jgi:hypothetical protein